MNVAIVGCGLIGQKRALALGECSLVACADVDAARADALAATVPDAAAETDYRRVVERDDVDIVVVATVHSVLAEVALAAAEAGKHVLVEKPAARRADELDPVIKAAGDNDVRVRIGYNHRYHPAMLKAREIWQSGAVGEPMFIRGRYGHGGRIGYDTEWRSRPEISGGGELIDQGAHLIDLSRMFLGDFTKVTGSVHTYFWNMPVEDNAFLLLETAGGQTALLHATWTEWKNLFSLELYGRDGKLEANGLGGSYGTERLTWYKMLPEMGPPETTTWEYPRGDESWAREFDAFLTDIRLGREPDPGLADAQAVLRVIETVYTETGT